VTFVFDRLNVTKSVTFFSNTNGEEEILVGWPLGRPRRRWVNNIKMDLREIGWGGMDWIDLAQDMDQWKALVNTLMDLRVP
jgi:hypothetical protein